MQINISAQFQWHEGFFKVIEDPFTFRKIHNVHHNISRKP